MLALLVGLVARTVVEPQTLTITFTRRVPVVRTVVRRHRVVRTVTLPTRTETVVQTVTAPSQ